MSSSVTKDICLSSPSIYDSGNKRKLLQLGRHDKNGEMELKTTMETDLIEGKSVSDESKVSRKF